jgi:hypothetical protein
VLTVLPARRLELRRSVLTYDWLSAAGKACQPTPGFAVMNPTNRGSPAATAPQSGGHCGTRAVAALTGVPAAAGVVAVSTSSGSSVPAKHMMAVSARMDRVRAFLCAPDVLRIATIQVTLSPLHRQGRRTSPGWADDAAAMLLATRRHRNRHRECRPLATQYRRERHPVAFDSSSKARRTSPGSPTRSVAPAGRTGAGRLRCRPGTTANLKRAFDVHLAGLTELGEVSFLLREGCSIMSARHRAVRN